MAKFFIAIIEWLSSLTMAFFSGKQQAELDHAKQSAHDLQAASNARTRADFYSDRGTIDPSVQRFYVDGDVLPDSQTDPKQHEKH